MIRVKTKQGVGGSMNGRIVIISPDEKFTEYAQQVIDDLGEDIEVFEGSYSEGLGKARKAVEGGASVIISRGGTGNLIKKNIDIPVVNIDFSSYDVIESIGKAVQYSNRIGIVGFEDLSKAYIRVSEILEKTFSTKIDIITIKSVREIDKAITELHHAGSRVFIGGHTVMEAIYSRHMNGVLIETGKEAIAETIGHAKRLLEVQQIEKEKAAILKSIIDFAYDGILGIDKSGMITVFNPVVQKITGIRYENAISRNVEEVVENTRMLEVLRTGEPELGEIQKIGDISILTNRVPIIVDDKIVGVVATFQEIEKIQKMETQIRAKLHAKGHVAKTKFQNIIGKSTAIAQVKEKARLYAKVDSTVLIQGETGTGKELFAQSIHNASLRIEKPFVAVNCAALPESLLESELFGYVEGAFTGARKGGKTGLFELAHGGTIFLDEISEMSPNLQARFLRVIQEKEVVRIGDDRVIPVDVRIIAATNRDLFKLVEDGGFREDLFYRLSVLRLSIPPLKERKEDISDLASHFVREKSRYLNQKVEGIAAEALAKLIVYDWPGNVRQLENFIERCVVLSGDKRMIDSSIADEASQGMLEFGRARGDKPEASNPQNDKGVLHQIENDTILKVLEETEGNRSLAADRLGISVTTLWRKLKSIEEANTKKK